MQPLLAMVIVGNGHSIQSSQMQSLLVAVIVGYSHSIRKELTNASLSVTVTPQGVTKLVTTVPPSSSSKPMQ